MTEIKRIKERQKDIYYSEYFIESMGESTDFPPLIHSEADDTFYYPDINYEGKTASFWEAAEHYLRLDHEIISEGRERLRSDSEWRSSLIGALRYWIKRDPINSNWWYNQIGAPRVLASIAIALEEYLPRDVEDGLKRIISRGIFRAHEGITEIDELRETTKCITADQWTGANLIWGAATTIKYALFVEDEKLLRIAVERLGEEIAFSREGVQEDGAFCQHGPRWYSGGYGRSFVYELAPIITILCGTSYALPEEKIAILLHHILDGQRAMMKNGIFDFSALGREYTRKGAMSSGILKRAIALLKEAEDIGRRDELEAFYSELQSEHDDHAFTKYYGSIAQLCHKKNGVYIGVRGRTEGLYGAEICNDEGVLSYNMTYGTITCIMENGREYFDIAPFWDYSKLPGTTARSEDDEALMSHRGWEKTLETPCRAFGRSDDESGIMAQYTEHDGISLTAAYFVFDGAMVALGTDIKDATPEKGALFTTVEQCRASSAELGKDRVKCGKLIYKNLDENTSFVSSLENKKGSWSRNSLASDSTLLEDRILTVTIPATKHGKYAYLVSINEEAKVEVLRNDSECQAILADGKKLMAVFYSDVTLRLGDRSISGKKGEIILN